MKYKKFELEKWNFMQKSKAITVYFTIQSTLLLLIYHGQQVAREPGFRAQSVLRCHAGGEWVLLCHILAFSSLCIKPNLSVASIRNLSIYLSFFLFFFV